ncbi:hypothetical protein ACFV9D_24785 [Streptomyces sp. NPDC059875]
MPRFYSPAEQLIQFGERASLASAQVAEDMRKLLEEEELAEAEDDDGDYW